MTNDNDSTKRAAAMALLRKGLATQSEVAELAQKSRQLVRYWAGMAKIDSSKARAKYLARIWLKATTQK